MKKNYLVNVSVEVEADSRVEAEEMVCMKIAPPQAVEERLEYGFKAVWVGSTKTLVRK